MAWPTATDYHEAVQDLRRNVADDELRAGQPALTQLGLPMIWAGGFADVYKIHAEDGNAWALKCFTRKVAGQADRYQRISNHLERARLPFMVDFKYLDRGIRVRGEWYPALKMRWVEGGIALDQFVLQYLNRPRTLKQFLGLWVKMEGRLRQAKIAHADLQHGNVLLVPRDDGNLALRLIDYDGMYVPAFAGSRSGELGHSAFQHPQRKREGIYSAEVDRFSNLAIYSAIHCLTVGRQQLWDRFDNGDNLLFREEDFQDPANSDVFHALWELPDEDSRSLVGRLVLACNRPLDQTPLLKEVANGHVFPLTSEGHRAVNSILGSSVSFVPAAAVAPDPAVPSSTQLDDLLAAEELPPAETTPEALLTSKPKPEPGNPFAQQIKFSPLAGLRLFDRFLARLAGEENVILQSFLWVVSVVCLLAVVVGLPAYVALRTGGSTNTQLEDNSFPLPGAVTDSTALPEDVTNSIGMKFKRIEPGEFMMGSPEDDPNKADNETPQHQVQITKPFYLGIHEVTQDQYEKVTGENPSQFKGAALPVERVSWKDAIAFCAELSETDDRFEYFLPTEAEWEYACRAGTTTSFSSGDDLDPLSAWSGDSSDEETHPVGRRKPNAWGLYDMHGNVWEWCQDRFGSYADSQSDDPRGPASGSNRVNRGGDWKGEPADCRSASRGGNSPSDQSYRLGFRVALLPKESASERTTGLYDDTTNSIGMKFKLIEPGEFMMGSPKSDKDRRDDEQQHRVQITRPFCLGAHEVTQEQYRMVMGKNPSNFKGPTLPVEEVSWDDATAFCAKLSKMDSRFNYRLPTEAEWEYACRAGTTTRFSCGDELNPRYAWSDDNSYDKTHPVGEKRPNAWGLHDMHGNVSEWCQDRYDDDYYEDSPSANPGGPTSGSDRVVRGGGWSNYPRYCRSAHRAGTRSYTDNRYLGFRVALVPRDEPAEAKAEAGSDRAERSSAKRSGSSRYDQDRRRKLEAEMKAAEMKAAAKAEYERAAKKRAEQLGIPSRMSPGSPRRRGSSRGTGRRPGED